VQVEIVEVYGIGASSNISFEFKKLIHMGGTCSTS
jgi:hypothetical protein